MSEHNVPPFSESDKILLETTATLLQLALSAMGYTCLKGHGSDAMSLYFKMRDGIIELRDAATPPQMSGTRHTRRIDR
jgi:hypothetical protein